MAFQVGSLVKARNREWVVLPESSDDFLVIRPLGGTDDEIAGIDTGLENVDVARFDLPDPSRLGDFRSTRLLRDAVRLGLRSSAGPFRSFAQIAVEPRPYQLVPLLMALRLDPVRLLIADDVGIGKTIEALLIARELLDRGEITRLSVLCPPHLAEQWQEELRDKFHIDAELVLSSTARKLDKHCGNRSPFEVFPFTVVSLDYIKSDARREQFKSTCPNFVIVDEAHTCTSLGQAGHGRKQQRHQLVRELSVDPDRHMLFVTATPHSGNEHGFRSLLELVNPDFGSLPDDLGGEANRAKREELARYFVQRRRVHIRDYLRTDTQFPERLEKEETYTLGDSEYRKLFSRLLKYARETVRDSEGMKKARQRVRWWAALGLLRALASSPAAAAATLRSKASAVDALTPEQVDEISRPLVLDEDIDESEDVLDYMPGADTTGLDDDDEDAQRERRRLLEMARAAEELEGDGDPKLQAATRIVKGLLKQKTRPILFCRFIATAEYLAEQLREALPNKVVVQCITGKIPATEREKRIDELVGLDECVLVCTDCLSEGINLQHVFDAVVHYDLSWNPTRHEQREGRVDRFGQVAEEVFVVTFYGVDNQIDGVVLEVLIRKHKAIRKALGISIPVPSSSNAVLEALYEGLLLRNQDADQLVLDFGDDLNEKRNEFDAEWQNAADRETKTRSLFSQETIKVDEVGKIVESLKEAIGSTEDVETFATTAVEGLGGTVVSSDNRLTFNLVESSRAVREAAGNRDQFHARFHPSVARDEIYLSRTHPFIDGLATCVLDSALGSATNGDATLAARCGAIRTRSVQTRTTLLLARFRYHLLVTQQGETTPLLAEDCQMVAFEGAPDDADWLDPVQTRELLQATPEENVNDDVARSFIETIVQNADHLMAHLDTVATERGEELLQQHQDVRRAAQRRGIQYNIEPQLPADLLGVYVFVPVL